MPIDFVRGLFDRLSGRVAAGIGGGSERAPQLLQLFTPNIVGPDRPALRVLIGGATLVGLAVAGAVALSSLMALLGALFGLYLLLTQVLGLELNIDPRAFVEEAQRYAAQARA